MMEKTQCTSLLTVIITLTSNQIQLRERNNKNEEIVKL